MVSLSVSGNVEKSLNVLVVSENLGTEEIEQRSVSLDLEKMIDLIVFLKSLALVCFINTNAVKLIYCTKSNT